MQAFPEKRLCSKVLQKSVTKLSRKFENPFAAFVRTAFLSRRKVSATVFEKKR
jgi:hypothetical protein